MFESGHDDLIHDAQLDYFGSTLATASADRSIKIFDVSGKQHAHVADLKGFVPCGVCTRRLRRSLRARTRP